MVENKKQTAEKLHDAENHDRSIKELQESMKELDDALQELKDAKKDLVLMQERTIQNHNEFKKERDSIKDAISTLFITLILLGAVVTYLFIRGSIWHTRSK